MSLAPSALHKLRPALLIHPSERPPLPPAEVRTARFRTWFVISKLTRLWLMDLWLRLAGTRTLERRRRNILTCLEDLGMLWIRIAQTLMLRRKELASRFGLRLLDIRDNGGAHPFEGIRTVITQDLGRPLEEVFDHFEETPFAATTVSQIHRAHLRRGGGWVAVKVQHPFAEAVFDKDLALFRRLIRLMKLLGLQSGMRWDDLFHELRELKERELNYYFEADALNRLDRNLTGQRVHVPKVFRELTSRRVLVMEFIRGIFLADCIDLSESDPERLRGWLESNNIDLKLVAKRLFHSVYRQIFEDNFFHGNLNTRAIILLRNSHVAIIECRSAGSLDTENHEKQKMYLRALADQEYVTAAEIYFLLSSRLPRVDLNTVKERLIRIWRVWESRVHIRGLAYRRKSLTAMNSRINRVALEYGFDPLWSFSRLNGAWVHLDNALACLDPEFNYLDHLREWLREDRGRRTVTQISDLPNRLAASLIALHELPKRFSEYNLFKEILIRRKAQVIQSSASKMDALIAAGFHLISLLCLVIFVFFGAAFMSLETAWDPRPLIGRQIGSLIDKLPAVTGLGWLIILAALSLSFVFFRNLRRRFNGREFGRRETATDMDL